MWAEVIGQLSRGAYDLTAEQAQWMTDTMLALEKGRGPEEHRFIYAADPLNTLFFVSLYQGPINLDVTVDDLSGVSDTDVVRPPIVEPFTSPYLGKGVRVLRHKDTGAPDHGTAAVLQYAWRVGGMDIVVIAGDYNIVELADLTGVLDEFARCISITQA